MNVNYGRLVENTVKHAPDNVRIGDVIYAQPTAEQYLVCGWKKVTQAYPEEPAPAGFHYETDGWEEDEVSITRLWKTVADPVVPRRWTRLKMKTALANQNMLPKVKAMLSVVEIAPSYTALEAFTDCDYVEEFWPDDQTWNGFLDSAAEVLGKTRAEIDAFLDSVPTEGGGV